MEKYIFFLLENQKKRTDTAGRETVYDYDDLNRLTKTIDANLQPTQFEYNLRNQMTEVKDALNQEYVFAYDALGRQLSQTRAGSVMSYEYDAVGCHVNNFSDVPNAPQFCYVQGSGGSQRDACQAAMNQVQAASPPETYARHCRCTECWQR